MARLIADSAHNFEVLGYYGLSLWLVWDPWTLERVLSEKTGKARRVAIFSVGELLAQGLGLVPSGRTPHYDTTNRPVSSATRTSLQVTAGSAEELVERFLRADYTVEDNPFYEQDPS